MLFETSTRDCTNRMHGSRTGFIGGVLPGLIRRSVSGHKIQPRYRPVTHVPVPAAVQL